VRREKGMCEATAYVISNGKEKEIMKDVVTIDVQGKRLLFRDILGNEKRLSAQIKKIDLLQHKVSVVKP
jgi:predicted RNA-binding protein